MLKKLVEEISNESITKLIKFKDFDEGWDYVEENKGEGLVIRDNRNWFKVKILQETKVEIKQHEPSKEKGTFILIDNNRVSGTSKDFVRRFWEIKAQGKKPIAEIEYQLLTKNGSYFQPRLRRIFVEGEE